MAIRAFIVAVEKYDPLSGLSDLTGMNADTLALLRWLTDTKKVDEVILCAEAGLSLPAPRAWAPVTKYDCDRDGVKKALKDLKSRVNPAVTQELYCYFAGHGFQYSGPLRTTDHLVLSKLADWTLDGDQTLSLDEVRDSFLDGLGYGDQFYFADACRVAPGGSITPVGTGITFPPFGNSRAVEYFLSPVPPGHATWTRNQFARELVNGLEGMGKAKDWVRNRMFVLFGRLSDFVFKKVGTVGESRGKFQTEIFEINPVPQCDGVIKVDGLSSGDTVDVTASYAALPIPFQVQAPEEPTPSSLLPRDYDFTASYQGQSLDLVEPAPGDDLDCFEAFTVRFALPVSATGGTSSPSSGGGSAAASAQLQVTAVDDTVIQVVDHARLRTWQSPAPFLEVIPGGTYEVRVLQDGAILRKETVRVGPDRPADHSLEHLRQTPHRDLFRNAILSDQLLRQDVEQAGLASETNRWDLAQWVAFLGASTALGRPTKFSSLDRPFRPHPTPFDSGIWILSACEHIPGPFLVSISRKPSRADRALEAVPELNGLYQGHRSTEREGSFYCTFQFGGFAPVTFASYHARWMTTLITLTESPSGRIRIHQYLVPVHPIGSPLSERVVRGWLDGPLSLATRTSFLAQRRFARGQAIGDDRPDAWDHLMSARWVDPILTSLIAYDLFRHRMSTEGISSPPAGFVRLLEAIKEEFGALPDIQALNRLGRREWQQPSTPPLLLYGTRCLDPDRGGEMLPLPPEWLDSGGPWTSWVNAVEPAATNKGWPTVWPSPPL